MNSSSLHVEGLFNLCADLLCVAEFNGAIQRVNFAWERTLGFKADGVTGLPLSAFIHPNDWDAAAERFAQLASRRHPEVFECRCRTRDGDWRWLEWSVAAVPGQPMFFACARDITDRKRAEIEILTETKKLEMQFLRAQRLESIGTLAGGGAHDLNNILTPILMSVNLLRESLTDPDDRRLLETLRLCAQRGADMVKQILAFTRGRHGGRGVISLAHLVSEWAKIARETFPRSIRIEVEAGREIWNVDADATQIYQVLMNLCVNARDAMPAGGDLAVTLRNVTLDEKHRPLHPDARPGRYVRLMVTDTGIGIAPENLDQIWEPSFSVKAPGEGTGLGLPSVLRIARGHGGFVHVDSRIGQGSCFEVYFPAAIVPELEPGPEPEATFSQGRGETILVVDDERAIQEFTSAIFARHGYRVLTAGDGTEALALFAQQKDQIDLVLTDMMMPCLDGFATIRGLQRIKPGLPVIVTSGLAENEAVARELGRTSFLLKPFTTERLLHAVSESLRAPWTSSCPASLS